jgi:hypothetical protein
VAFRAKNGVSGEKWGFSIKKGDFVCKIEFSALKSGFKEKLQTLEFYSKGSITQIKNLIYT